MAVASAISICPARCAVALRRNPASVKEDKQRQKPGPTQEFLRDALELRG
jgi:hypothetical protein